MKNGFKMLELGLPLAHERNHSTTLFPRAANESCTNKTDCIATTNASGCVNMQVCYS